MLENERVLVLDDGDGHVQFHRNPRLPLAIPPRVLFEDREDLLLLRCEHSLEDPPVRLLDLALRVHDVLVQFLQFLRPGTPLC